MTPASAVDGRVNPAPGRPARSRYTVVAILLHWSIAAAILGLLGSGLWMTEAIRDPARQARAFEIYQLHKAFGLTVLVLTIIRLVWRLGHRPPPLPAGTPGWQRVVSHAVHLSLYGLTLAVPVAGWLMVSASPLGFPTVPFGLFEWPHLPVLGLGVEAETLESVFKLAHRSLAYVTAGLLVLHVGAALFHQFVERDGLIGRMGFGQRISASGQPARADRTRPLPGV